MAYIDDHICQMADEKTEGRLPSEVESRVRFREIESIINNSQFKMKFVSAIFPWKEINGEIHVLLGKRRNKPPQKSTGDERTDYNRFKAFLENKFEKNVRIGFVLNPQPNNPWCSDGGKLEKYTDSEEKLIDTPLNAALREFKEETGIEPSLHFAFETFGFYDFFKVIMTTKLSISAFVVKIERVQEVHLDANEEEKFSEVTAEDIYYLSGVNAGDCHLWVPIRVLKNMCTEDYSEIREILFGSFSTLDLKMFVKNGIPLITKHWRKTVFQELYNPSSLEGLSRRQSFSVKSSFEYGYSSGINPIRPVNRGRSIDMHEFEMFNTLDKR